MRPRIRCWLECHSWRSSACLPELQARARRSSRRGASRLRTPASAEDMPDAAENLPDGTGPDPLGSFPHIPYYAIGCTLEDIESRSNGRMEVEVIGRSALGRDMYKVDDQCARHPGAAERGRAPAAGHRACPAQSAPGPGADRAPRPEGPDLHPGQHPRQRVRGHRRGHAHDRAGRHDAVRSGRAGRQVARPRRARLQRDPEPGRPYRRHARERQRVRPEPRLHHAVAARDGGICQRDTRVVPDWGVRPAWVRRADARRGHHRAAQPGHRVRPLDEVEPAPHGREPGRARARGLRHHPADRQHPAREWIPEGETLPQGWDDWGPFYTGSTASCVASTR